MMIILMSHAMPILGVSNNAHSDNNNDNMGNEVIDNNACNHIPSMDSGYQ